MLFHIFEQYFGILAKTFDFTKQLKYTLYHWIEMITEQGSGIIKGFFNT